MDTKIKFGSFLEKRKKRTQTVKMQRGKMLEDDPAAGEAILAVTKQVVL